MGLGNDGAAFLPFAMACTCSYLVAKSSLQPEHLDAGKVVANVFLFLGPALAFAYTHGEWMAAAGAVLFAFAAVGVGAEREEFLFGMRREDWFHYMIGSAAMLLALAIENH